MRGFLAKNGDGSNGHRRFRVWSRPYTRAPDKEELCHFWTSCWAAGRRQLVTGDESLRNEGVHQEQAGMAEDRAEAAEDQAQAARDDAAEHRAQQDS